MCFFVMGTGRPVPAGLGSLTGGFAVNGYCHTITRIRLSDVITYYGKGSLASLKPNELFFGTGAGTGKTRKGRMWRVVSCQPTPVIR